MRAAYQLNQEKLDYNYRVLLERDAENQATITQQKRKISKQRDLLSTLMVEFLDSSLSFSAVMLQQYVLPYMHHAKLGIDVILAYLGLAVP